MRFRCQVRDEPTIGQDETWKPLDGPGKNRNRAFDGKNAAVASPTGSQGNTDILSTVVLPKTSEPVVGSPQETVVGVSVLSPLHNVASRATLHAS